MWFDTFRVGIWPEYFPGVQFSKDSEALNQYFRQMTPNVGQYDPEVISDACAALFNKIGPAVFVTHSQGGGLGWATVLKTGNVRGIVAYEPGSGFLFPEGEVPETLPSSGGALAATGVPMAQFMKLTKIPIIVFYGDFIPERPSDNPARMDGEYGSDGQVAGHRQPSQWRCGHCVHLPEVGVQNTHFPFSEIKTRSG
jgi:pimeloyl-ACP methyl ester carboxylesterase